MAKGIVMKVANCFTQNIPIWKIDHKTAVSFFQYCLSTFNLVWRYVLNSIQIPAKCVKIIQISGAKSPGLVQRSSMLSSIRHDNVGNPSLALKESREKINGKHNSNLVVHKFDCILIAKLHVICRFISTYRNLTYINVFSDV